MQALMDFEANVVHSEFIEMFGKEKADGLWNSFKSRCGSNTTIFYRILEPVDREKFNKFLLKTYPLNKNKS